MGDKVLPPMPKLRPRPGLGTLSSELPPPLKKRRVVQPQPQHNGQFWIKNTQYQYGIVG